MGDNEKSTYRKVESALVALFREDRDLLDVNANERSISHKLAEHLQKKFRKLKVDCEYNRHGRNVKELRYQCDETAATNDLEAKTVFPDIVVHQRGSDESNLLVIEIKKANLGKNAACDAAKLRAFTRKKEEGKYHYAIGLHLSLDVGVNRVRGVRCFKDGKEVRDTIWANLKESGYGG